MRIDDLEVELRPRSAWEAVELGMALVRANAAAVWKPWLLLSLPVFAVANLVGWQLDLIPLAALLMWWLKPVFDRIALYVLSRAVFGARPGVRETLAAQLRWGWRPMLHYLSWRRLGLARSMYLPVDLLEGGANSGERRRVIGGSARGVGVLLTITCLHFEAAISIAALMLALLFVPVEFLSESARAMWALVSQQPPPWAQVALNAVAWLATSLIEPFYVGGGLGLYLNRRTQLEAWDVEIAFRRMRRRLLATAAPALAIAAGLALSIPAYAAAPMPAQPLPGTTRSEPADSAAAQPAAPAAAELREVFGPQFAPHAQFEKAVERVQADPLLNPRERRSAWQPRDPRKTKPDEPDGWAEMIGVAIARIGEAGLWILLALAAAAALWTSPRWWPQLREAVQARPAQSAVTVEPLPAADALPDDVPAAARALWHDGRRRRALALVYRASVHSMMQRTGATLVPGATEAECVRAARALREPDDRDAFAQTVRVWQHAAYAGRLPSQDEFEALLARLSHRFGWAA